MYDMQQESRDQRHATTKHIDLHAHTHIHTDMQQAKTCNKTLEITDVQQQTTYTKTCDNKQDITDTQ